MTPAVLSLHRQSTAFSFAAVSQRHFIHPFVFMHLRTPTLCKPLRCTSLRETPGYTPLAAIFCYVPRRPRLARQDFVQERVTRRSRAQRGAVCKRGCYTARFMKGRSDVKSQETERIAKVIARAGLCSRRDAERWIADGRVSVNGRTLESPAFTVAPDDRILVDGKPLPKSEVARVFLYHKPAGLVTTSRDERDRPTVFENLPAGLPRVISVGRLDLNSEGLLLLTNDGGLARYLELPATGMKRRYRVRVHGTVKPADLAALARGLTVDGVKYGPIDARMARMARMEREQSGANAWLSVTLQEGKNREIRKVLAHLGLQVNRLIRTAYGPFELGDLAPGEVTEVKPEALRAGLPGYFG